MFVNFDPQPKMTLAQWLGKFHDQYKGFFSNRQRIASYRIMVEANWNVAINSFSEGYHAAYVHRKTVPDYQGGKQNPQRHRAYLEITDYHGRYSAQANPNRRVTPVEEIAYRDGRPLYPSFPLFSEDGLPLPPGVNASRNENWGFDVAEVFPVLIWIIGAHWHANLWFWPAGVDKTDVRVEFFAYKAETVGDCLAHAYFRTRLREVFREDVGTMEQVTSALKAGAMQSILLSQPGVPAAAALCGRRTRCCELRGRIMTRAAAAAAVQRARAVRRRMGADQRSRPAGEADALVDRRAEGVLRRDLRARRGDQDLSRRRSGSTPCRTTPGRCSTSCSPSSRPRTRSS